MKSWTIALLYSWSALAFANTEVWIDVGSQEEYAAEHLYDAVHIPYTHIARGVSARYPNKDTAIKLYGRDGARAQQASQALQILGYQQATHVGGLAELKASGFVTQQATSPSDLTSDDVASTVSAVNDTASLYSDEPNTDAY